MVGGRRKFWTLDALKWPFKSHSFTEFRLRIELKYVGNQ